jgi:hypothetical protein
VHRAEAAFLVGESSLQEYDDLIFSERLQHVDARAGEQCAVNFKGWIFRGRTDQADAAFLYVRKKCILLSFVEAVNFVDEDNGACAILPGALGVGHDLLDFFDPGEHGGELDELRFRHVGDNFCERSLASAGRSPEDERPGVVALDLNAQRFAGTDEMLLAGVFFERARAHAVGQRPSAVSGTTRFRNGLEESHNKIVASWL